MKSQLVKPKKTKYAMDIFSVKYLPTTLFSLKDSNSTNSGAKALFLPSPYAIKMAVLNQAITMGGELEDLQKRKSKAFQWIRDAEINFYIEEGSFFVVNNSFVKILKPSRSGTGFGRTVSFREYLFLSKPLEIIFKADNEDAVEYLKRYLHNINYFGKRGCFFQFLEYPDTPKEANVKPFKAESGLFGVLQEYDDFDDKATFENVSNYSSKSAKRKKSVLVLPLQSVGSSKSFSCFRS
ncbi:hypothetical protein [Flexithrix dorotheae]|uniref:hypothetical protein n=1 Tax=Flexithrix dorotheae TaxID=70993 RepID=UPI00037CB6DB|nr:hypothetical protein [Flexithrix dorotheae]